MRGKQIIFLLAILMLWAYDAAAQDMAMPVKVQYPLFLKILSFDRNLETRVGEEIVIGIIYQPRVRSSWLAKDAMLHTIVSSGIRVKNIPVRGVAIEANNPQALEQAIAEHHVDLLYVAPLRALEIQTIAAVSQAQQITTLTGVPAYIEDGLAVGIRLVGEQPEILVNLPAAKAEGAQFKARLLKLAHVIQGEGADS